VFVSKGVGHRVCVSYFVTRELLCNYLPVLVECENPTRVGRGFYLGWAQGFPRKNFCVHYFHIIYLLSSQEQPVRSGELTVCEIRQEHNSPPSCVLYSKSQQVVSEQFLLIED